MPVSIEPHKLEEGWEYLEVRASYVSESLDIGILEQEFHDLKMKGFVPYEKVDDTTLSTIIRPRRPNWGPVTY